MRSTKLALRQRIEEVLNLRLLGAEFVDIRQHASAQGWNVSDRQLFRYIEGGDKILSKTLERNRDRLLDRHIAQRRALYARCMAVSDYASARAVLRDEAELLGLYPSKKTELTGSNGAPVQLHIVEEIVGRTPAALDVKEILVLPHDNNTTPTGHTQQNGSAASVTESLPGV
jgi:hypothetical protein